MSLFGHKYCLRLYIELKRCLPRTNISGACHRLFKARDFLVFLDNGSTITEGGLYLISQHFLLIAIFMALSFGLFI